MFEKTGSRLMMPAPRQIFVHTEKTPSDGYIQRLTVAPRRDGNCLRCSTGEDNIDHHDLLRSVTGCIVGIYERDWFFLYLWEWRTRYRLICHLVLAIFAIYGVRVCHHSLHPNLHWIQISTPIRSTHVDRVSTLISICTWITLGSGTVTPAFFRDLSENEYILEVVILDIVFISGVLSDKA